MRRTFMAVLGSAALAATGCGGDEDSKPLTKAEYIAKADAICSDVDKATNRYDEQGDALPRDAQVKEFALLMKGTLEENARGDERLRALPRPSEDRVTLDRFYSLRARAAEVGAEAAEAAEDNDLDRFQALLSDNSELGPDQTKLAKQYGFKECAPGD